MHFSLQLLSRSKEPHEATNRNRTGTDTTFTSSVFPLFFQLEWKSRESDHIYGTWLGTWEQTTIAVHVTKEKNPLLVQLENNKFIFNTGEHE